MNRSLGPQKIKQETRNVDLGPHRGGATIGSVHPKGAGGQGRQGSSSSIQASRATRQTGKKTGGLGKVGGRDHGGGSGDHRRKVLAIGKKVANPDATAKTSYKC